MDLRLNAMIPRKGSCLHETDEFENTEYHTLKNMRFILILVILLQIKDWKAWVFKWTLFFSWCLVQCVLVSVCQSYKPRNMWQKFQWSPSILLTFIEIQLRAEDEWYKDTQKRRKARNWCKCKYYTAASACIHLKQNTLTVVKYFNTKNVRYVHAKD